MVGYCWKTLLIGKNNRCFLWGLRGWKDFFFTYHPVKIWSKKARKLRPMMASNLQIPSPRTWPSLHEPAIERRILGLSSVHHRWDLEHEYPMRSSDREDLQHSAWAVPLRPLPPTGDHPRPLPRRPDNCVECSVKRIRMISKIKWDCKSARSGFLTMCFFDQLYYYLFGIASVDQWYNLLGSGAVGWCGDLR